MKTPTRLIEDETLGDDLRAGLRAAKATSPVDYDTDKGYARLTAVVGGIGIAGGTGAAAAHAASSASGGTAGATAVTTTKAGLSIKAIVAGVAATCAIGGSIAYGVRSERAPAPANTIDRTTMVAPMSTNASPPKEGPAIASAPMPPPSESPVTEDAPPAPKPSAKLPAPSASAKSVQPEMDQLAQIRAAQGDPASALRLAEEGQARFPGGVFSQERELAAIFALKKLGRESEAKARAEAFLAAHPETPAKELLTSITGH